MASVVQSRTGAAAGTNRAATAALSSTARVGNRLFCWLAVDKDSGSDPTFSRGWSLVPDMFRRTSSITFGLYEKIAEGTSADQCAFAWTTGLPYAWVIVETDLTSSATYNTLGNFSNGTTAVSSVALSSVTAPGDGLAFAAVAVDTLSNWTSGGVSGNYTNGFSESLVSTNDCGITIGWIGVLNGATVSTTVSSPSGGRDQASGILIAVGEAASGADLPLDTVPAVGDASLRLTAPTQIPLDAVDDSLSNATLRLTAPALLTLRADGVGSVTLSIRAGSAPDLDLDTVAGTGEARLSITAQTRVPLGTVPAVGNTTLRLSVPTGIPLGPVAGISDATLRLRAATRLVFGRVDNLGNATLSIRVPTPEIIRLDAVAGLGNATLSVRFTLEPGTVRKTLVIREIPPLWLACVAAPPGSSAVVRWGGDEPLAENTPRSTQIVSSVPGGFDTAATVLARKSGGWPDMERLTDLTFHGAGGRIAWEGRLAEAPSVSGDELSISPGAVGHKSHLEDDPTASVIFISRDISRFEAPGAQRRLNIMSANFPHQQDASSNWDDGVNSPALALQIAGPWGAPGTPRPSCETWYDSGAGNTISRIAGSFSGWPDVDFILHPLTSSDLVATVWEGVAGGDVYRAASGTFDHRPTARYRYGVIIWGYGGPSNGADGATYAVKVYHVRIYGDHNLTELTGTDGFVGYLASDMIRYAIQQWAPDLRIAPGSVQPTSYVIPQAAFHEQGGVIKMVDELTRYGLEDWGVWDKKTFHLYRRGTFGRRWRVRVGEARLKETGPTIERLWNGVIVQYQDVDGTTRTVGPPGSGCDTESALLLDTDPNNPANKKGIVRYAPPLEMGIPSVSGAAIKVGQQFLAETKALDRSGSAEIVGVVEDDKGVLHPAWAVRGGDTVSFIDAYDTSYRRIVRASYNEDTLTTSIDLDAPPEGVAAILARLGLAVAGLD